ncbi:MAG: hypothetical protein L6Q97_06760 [Thermoanaerobaculia bacterium]|nr:hypothetical protein [Thermoanaerobaculia bacterium]
MNMYRYVFICLFFCLPLSLSSQVDTPRTQAEQIAAGRQGLITGFRDSDKTTVKNWLLALRILEDDNYLPLQWDERWLLYFWLNDYNAVLGEAARFTNAWEETNRMKIPPPDDSLFNIVDNGMYNGREQYFEQIQQASLPAEDKAFSGLLLNYLLRLSTEEPAASEYDARLDSFLQHYPKTRYKRFMRKRMYNIPPPHDWALSLDFHFFQGNWSGMLERNFRTAYGADFGLGYWRKRWNLSLRVPVGGQKVDQPVEAKGYFWEKGESSVFWGVEMETGYDLVNQPRLRIFPMVGGGYSTLRPPSGDEDDPNPDYFDFFKFQGMHLSAAIHADVKFRIGDGSDSDSYQGVRLRVGHRWLNLGGKNPALQGNMFFFAVGYVIFGRQH